MPVESTRSQNITVTCRRSPVASARGHDSVAAIGCADAGAGVGGVVELGYRAQHFAPMAEQDAEFLQVLIGQIGKDREINAVLGKALRVLGHAELFEPVRNLLHCGAPSDGRAVFRAKISD